MKYCCLHQQIKRPNITPQSLHYQDIRRTVGDGCSTNEEEQHKQQAFQQQTENENIKMKIKNRPTILERTFELGK